MGRKKKQKIVKEEISDDFCFVCKDGGFIRACDYRGCLKVYHPECVGKEDSFLKDHVRWTCSWHSCYGCQKTAKFHCFCCPYAVCKCCLGDTGFVIVKRHEGFCSHCLKLVQLIEENKDVDCDGVKIDFEDQSTYECLFKMYWLTVKEKAELTSECIYVAFNDNRKVENHESDYEDDNFMYSDSESSPADSDSDDLNYMDNGRLRGRKSSVKNKKNTVKGKMEKKKKEFKGWASKSLEEFLISIGTNVTKKLSQYEVTSIINRYSEESKLFHPNKKKKILCDERLKSLLRKKTINKNRLYSALEFHFAENWEQSEDDEDTSSSSNSIDNKGSAALKRQESLSLDRGTQRDIESDARQHLFASIIPQNIKLVYLNRSLVQELLKCPEQFESKVVGCFVRVKSDPNDFMQKNSHQLVQVTGVKRISTTRDSGAGIVLLVPYMVYDIEICKLSDEDFSEEECEDLRQRMNTGLLRRPTVMELEQKARCLHADKTKHWIQRELAWLQRLIDRANEKGWRREFQEYWERRNLLQTPSEQSRLLNTVPEVTADTEDLSSAINKENHDLPESEIRTPPSTVSVEHKSIENSCQMNGEEDASIERFHSIESIYKKTQQLKGLHYQDSSGEAERDDIGENDVLQSTFTMKQSPIDPGTELPKSLDLHGGDTACQSTFILQDRHQGECCAKMQYSFVEFKGNEVGDKNVLKSTFDMKQSLTEPEIMLPQPFDLHGSETIGQSTFILQDKHHSDCIAETQAQLQKDNLTGVEVIHLTNDDTSDDQSEQQADKSCLKKPIGPENQATDVGQVKAKGWSAGVEVIDLSDDQDDSNVTPENKTREDPDSPIWYLTSPHCGTSGPHSLSLLKSWIESQEGTFKFKVWREGQSQGSAVLLTDAIKLFYPRN